MAAGTRSRPLYAVFLEQVIQIEAVQCHREAVTDDYSVVFSFFRAGCRLGGHYQWSLDMPEQAFPGLPVDVNPAMDPVSPPMQRALDAAVVAFKGFIEALRTGELVANGMYPATGVRDDLNPVEWRREGLILNVFNGDLYEGHLDVRRNGDLQEVHHVKHLRWSGITLRAAKQPRQKKGRGHGYDWEGAWTYATALRAEDQWDWTQHRRDKKQPLPAVRKVVEDRIKDWFRRTHRGRVPDISDIRQNITIPLYAGRRTRGKRTR